LARFGQDHAQKPILCSLVGCAGAIQSIHCAFVPNDASHLDEAQITALLSTLSDETLVAMVRRGDHLQENMPGELQRRLLESNRQLKSSSDKASRRLLVATWVLIVLTVVIAILTGALVAADWHSITSLVRGQEA
jgi:hypothetical protein